MHLVLIRIKAVKYVNKWKAKTFHNHTLMCAGMVAEAMAVELPTSKASSAPPPPPVKVKHSFWSFWPFTRRRSAYKTLKDVDTPQLKQKGSADTGADDDTDEGPLLKAGDPTTAKYAEKLKRKAVSEDEEPFIPRPNSRITFKLPDKEPSEDVTPEAPATQQAEIAAEDSPKDTALMNSKVTEEGQPASSLIPANNDVPTGNTTAADGTATLI